VVTDTGTTPLSATNSFTVVVNEVNLPPVLPAQSDRTVAQLATLVVTNTATDSDIPANILTYTLIDPPQGAQIDAKGIITWTPTALNELGANIVTTVVTDYSPGAVNSQHLSATNSFAVTVAAPVPPPIILSIMLTNGVATVTWSASADHSYRLEHIDNLTNTEWQTSAADVTAAGPTASATNNFGSASQRFYRVRLLQ